MTELAPQKLQENELNYALPSKEQPVYFEDSVDEQRLAHFAVQYGDRQLQVGGILRGYYANEAGQQVNIVSPLRSPDEVVEVVNGEAVRTLRGQYLPGEQVSILEDTDADWTVLGWGDNEQGQAVTFVWKMEGDKPIQKNIPTDELRALNESGVALPETSLEREQRHEQARIALGVAALESVIAPVASEVFELPEMDQPEAQPETEGEMHDRLYAELKTRSDELYRQHRKLDPNSTEAQLLNRQIDALKTQMGKHAQYRFRQRGF